MLSFIESLKELIFDVNRSGGNTLQKIAPPTDMTLKLKAYAIKQLRQEPQLLIEEVEGYLLEEFNEGLFEQGLNAAFTYLREMGIVDEEEMMHFLRQVIDIRHDKYLREKSKKSFINQSATSVDKAIVKSIYYVWDELGSESSQLYSFAKNRFLIRWDYSKSCWKITSLGKFFLDLNPIQAITFILTIDLTLHTDRYDFTHISQFQLEYLLDPRSHPPVRINLLIRDLIIKLGILRGSGYYEDFDTYEFDDYKLAPLGLTAIKTAISKENPMRSMVHILIENEEQGILFKGAEKEVNVLLVVIETTAISESIKISVGNALTLYKSGKYLDASRIIFPEIESIASQMLKLIGENPDDSNQFRGLANKLDKLEQRGLISPDLAKSIEITTSRNKVLHGQFNPTDQEYAYPLCVAGLIFLRRILEQLNLLKP